MTGVLTADFQRHRPHLLSVGYRLTGSWADAEDAVQESWLRLQRTQPTELRDLRGWLTVVVSRICLDRLRSATAQRERYVGPWLPEPVVTPVDGPVDEVVQDEGVRMAVLVVLELLTPDQRVAFVLHDAFAVPYADIAALLGCTVVAARQHASRGRRIVTDADPPPRASLAEQRRVLEAVSAAVAAADLDALVRLLHPDAVVVGDGGGTERTARRPVRGADKVARFLVGLARHYGPDRLGAARPVLVNGDLGLLIPAWPAVPGRRPALARRVSCFAVSGGRVAAVFDVVNPAKLTGVPD